VTVVEIFQADGDRSVTSSRRWHADDATRLGHRGWLVGMALCAFAISQARFVADLSSFLPAAPTEQQRLLVDQLRDGAISRVMLIGIDGGDPRAPRRSLARARRAAASRREVRVGGRTAPAGFERERELLLAYRYVMSSNVTPARFETEGLRAAIARPSPRSPPPRASRSRRWCPRDLHGEMLAVAEQLRPRGGSRIPSRASGPRPTERARCWYARTRASGSDTDAQARRRGPPVRAAFGEIAAGRGMRMVTSGPGVFSARARGMIERDVERLAFVSLAIVVTALLLVYRSPLALGLGLIPVVSGAGRGHRGGLARLRRRARHHARLRHHADRRGGRLLDLPLRAVGAIGARGRLDRGLLAHGSPRRAHLDRGFLGAGVLGACRASRSSASIRSPGWWLPPRSRASCCRG
jgi:predicted exporter